MSRADMRAGTVTVPRTSGPPPRTVFVEVPRGTVLEAIYESIVSHRALEKATLYSVLNACREWRLAEDDVLGSKREGAAWVEPLA
jgi:Domain of unknown function (DUF4111)